MLRIDDTLQAVWFMDVDDHSNWLAALNVDDNGRVLFTWRMLYYVPDSVPFDDDDHASWYRGHVGGSLIGNIDKVRAVARMLSQHATGELFELLRGDRRAADFLADFKRQPWVAVRRATERPPPGADGVAP